MPKRKERHIEPPIQPYEEVFDYMGEKMVNRSCTKCKNVHPRPVDMPNSIYRNNFLDGLCLWCSHVKESRPETIRNYIKWVMLTVMLIFGFALFIYSLELGLIQKGFNSYLNYTENFHPIWGNVVHIIAAIISVFIFYGGFLFIVRLYSEDAYDQLTGNSTLFE